VHELTEDVFTVAHVQIGADVIVTLYPSLGTDAVWFDFDTREMRSQAEVDALCEFIRTLGRLVDGPVELSYEGGSRVFAVYEPQGDEFRWTY
jgi:hypothetical protein